MRTAWTRFAMQVALAGTLVAGSVAHAGGAWVFTDVTATAGVGYQHGWVGGEFDPASVEVGGVAAGDYDRDGWVDLYAVRGDVGPNLLFRNRGDGTFEDVAAAAGVALLGLGSSASFADVDGDGWLDLLVVGIGLTRGTLMQPVLFRNRGDGTFEDVSLASGLQLHRDAFSTAFGDPDRDGDLDLFIAQSGDNTAPRSSEHYWENQGDGTFADATVESGIDPAYRVSPGGDVGSLALTPNFADINNDGWPDLLVAGDFRTSQVFLNDGDGTFSIVTDAVISDENGMGAAVADVDGDGNLDWFVSSIFDPNGIAEGNWYTSGNRFYRGLGDGHFEDRTSAVGVRDGLWGWGSTFADLDNDGHMDLVHVNGWRRSDPDAFEYHDDPTRAFINDGDGTFTNRAAALGLDHPGQGRGIVAFDYDRDGDLDLFITNNQEGSVLLRNDGGNAQRHLAVRLAGLPPNTEAAGARVSVTTTRAWPFQEVRIGSNFVSQNPAALHFGVAQAATADVDVRWPNGTSTQLADVPTDQEIVVAQPTSTTSTTTTTLPGCTGSAGANDACVTGAGKPEADCHVEWQLRTPLAQVSVGRIVVVSCRDGDPSCDVGSDAATCRFRVVLCLANTSPHLPACVPADLASVDVKKPRATGRDAALHGAVRAALDAAGAVGGGAPFVGRDVCTAPVEVAVPVGERRGKARPGKRTLRVEARTVAGARDVDTLRFVCTLDP
jgi:hypothetical protein